MRTLIDRAPFLASAIFALSAALIFLTSDASGPAMAHIPPVPPDHSFAGSTLGLKDPTSKDVANAFWWLFKGMVITFGDRRLRRSLRNRWVRDWLTSPEYNEATGLRRRYIADGGEARREQGEDVGRRGDLHDRGLRDRCAARPWAWRR